MSLNWRYTDANRTYATSSELVQIVHHELADDLRFDFLIKTFLQFFFDPVDERLDLLDADGTLFAGLEDAGDDLVAVETFAPAVLLDDHERHFLDVLIGRKALLALQAFAAAADAFTFVR